MIVMCSFYIVLIIFSSQIFSIVADITDADYVLMPPLFHYDNYDLCMLHDDENAVYCMITFQVYPEESSNTSDVWKTIQEVSSNENNYRHDLLRHGICLAETCTDTPTYDFKNISKIQRKLTYCYQQKYKSNGLIGEIIKIRCEKKTSTYPIDNYDFTVGTLAIIYITFVVVITIYLAIIKYRSKTNYEKINNGSFGKIFFTFSIFENWQRLLHVDIENKNIKSLRCIQGLRFCSMIMVIAAHTLMIDVSVPVSNPLYVEQVPRRLISIPLSNGGFIVQTFFLISSFLLSFNMFLKCKEEGKIKFSHFLKAFINRYVRLTPSLAVVVAIHATWLVHLSRGPFWDQVVGEEYRRCRENWWTNLLYVNNHVNNERMCMVQTWYLAADTHYFVLGLIILWLTHKKPIWIYCISASIIVLQAVFLFTIIYWNQWEAFVRLKPELDYAVNLVDIKQWHAMIGSSYSNVAGFAVGISLGYTFCKEGTTYIFTNKISVIIWWILTWGLIFGVMFIPGLIQLSEDYIYNPLFAAIHGSISRPLFSCGIGLLLFGLIQEQGWMVRWVCKWFPVYILGRLTYSAYLIHTISVKVRIGSQRSPLYLTDEIMFMEVVTDLAIAYMGALILTLFVEMPIYTLGKQIQAMVCSKK